jgi:hypothetical protein
MIPPLSIKDPPPIRGAVAVRAYRPEDAVVRGEIREQTDQESRSVSLTAAPKVTVVCITVHGRILLRGDLDASFALPRDARLRGPHAP